MNADENAYLRFLSGDEKGLTELIDMYKEPIADFINSYINDEHTAQDIMLDVFVDLVRKKNFRFESSLKTFLYAVARRKALKYVSRRKQHISLEETENYIPSGLTADGQLISEEKKQAVLNAVRSLRDNYREAIFLVYFENMSYEQAAEVMHKNVKQISNYVFRAKQSLRVILSEEVSV